MASNLLVDLGDLSFGVGIPKETLDACPYLLKESTESIPSLLQQADEDSPAIGDEVGGFQPSGLQTCPSVGHQPSDAVDRTLEDPDEESFEVQPLRLQERDTALPFHFQSEPQDFASHRRYDCRRACGDDGVVDRRVLHRSVLNLAAGIARSA